VSATGGRCARITLRLAATVLLLASISGTAARARRTAERERQVVRMVDITKPLHVRGTNLPGWAACLFPTRANEGAIARARPCRAGARATRTYTRESVIGCWRIEGGERTARFAYTTRLRAAAPAGRRHGGAEGWGAMERMSRSAGHDPLDAFAPPPMWRFSPPDSVEMVTSAGLGAVVDVFRIRGDTLAGMRQFVHDVVDVTTDTAAVRVPRLTGVRVPCHG
jgi:hypothetical protein